MRNSDQQNAPKNSMGFGIAIGIAIGFGLGVAMNNFAVGISHPMLVATAALA